MADLNYVYFCVPFAVNRHHERNILLQPLQESQYLYSDDRQISLHPELRTIYTKLAGLRCDLPPQHHITARSCSSPWTTSTPATPVLLGSNSFLYLSPAVERFRLYLSPAGERSCQRAGQSLPQSCWGASLGCVVLNAITPIYLSVPGYHPAGLPTIPLS